MLDAIATRIPPGKPLSDIEKAQIGAPLEMVLYKHGTQIPCEWQLTIAVGFVAFGRYQDYQAAIAKLPAKEG